MDGAEYSRHMRAAVSGSGAWGRVRCGRRFQCQHYLLKRHVAIRPRPRASSLRLLLHFGVRCSSLRLFRNHPY
jgi:hypothetical protein